MVIEKIECLLNLLGDEKKYIYANGMEKMCEFKSILLLMFSLFIRNERATNIKLSNRFQSWWTDKVIFLSKANNFVIEKSKTKQDMLICPIKIEANKKNIDNAILNTEELD